MCQVISVAVHPLTGEVFHAPGQWHHTAICNKFGLDYDKVFKPEIHLHDKNIRFVDGNIAFTRTLPPELIQEILVLVKKYDQDANSLPTELQINIKGVAVWDHKHQEAVNRWIEKNVPAARQLMEFSMHTFDIREYNSALKREAQIDVSRVGYNARFSADGEKDAFERPGGPIHKAWLAQFMKDMNRVPVWKELGKPAYVAVR